MSFDKDYFFTNTYADVSFAKYSQYWWSNRFFAGLARRYGRAGSRLLEIGSGLGHLVGQLEGTFVTYGMDVNHWAVVHSRNEAEHTRLSTSHAQDLPFPSGSFGAVVIKHIVEHLPDPERAIREIGRILEPGGILILATPNLAGLLKPLKGDKWIGYQDPTHISLKLPKEWLGLIHAAGLSIVRAFADGFWNVPYIPVVPAIIQKFIFGSLGGLQALSGFVFLPVRWGESLIVVAKKG